MQNGFGGAKWVRKPLGFCTVFRTVLGMRNEFAGLIYFRTVCEIGSQGVRNFRIPCEMSHEFHMPCENFAGYANCLGFSFAKNL